MPEMIDGKWVFTDAELDVMLEKAEYEHDLLAAEIARERAAIADELDAMGFTWGKEMRDYIEGLRAKQ